ncbi:hypothetical protein DGWBC_1533 [Dehalogenimonas sp. WBC-2]|nr:hypothetical protein DGWBC_1533 [Dehalogenimonas sp. WBC-2]
MEYCYIFQMKIWLSLSSSWKSYGRFGNSETVHQIYQNIVESYGLPEVKAFVETIDNLTKTRSGIEFIDL